MRTSPDKTETNNERWEMDQDGPLDDAYLDMPIPYRMSHEAGLALEDIDPRGDVP